ncbi:MAG: DUF2807 domain-containing protein [Verrucomicrobiota bacterium]|nr:DUF2807 domain-containing protein [Verrucomicrobiota bacterium]
MSTILIRPFAALKLLTFAALAFLGACHMPGIHGNGEVVTEPRNVSNFSTIEAGGVFTIEWVTGAPALTITTDQNLLPHITTTVSGNRLRIDWDTQLRPTNGIKVKLSSAALTGAELNGAVRFSAQGLTGQSFVLEGNGATRMNLDGSVASLTASLNGASRLDAENLQTQACEMSISGAGRADVSATDSLRVAISGAGKVTYAGTPKRIEKNISGAGSIRRRD